jgi:histidine ammonia-lyase
VPYLEILNKMVVKIGKKDLVLEDVNKILYHNEKITLDPTALENVVKSFHFINDYSKDKIIYGVNTGFGPMAPYVISDKDQQQLQYNLIRSHAAGTGGWLPHDAVKATMLARLSSIMQGFSGVHPSVPQLLKELINRNIYPFIPKHGGVGASGDLVQLAHLAVTLIGEGDVSYKGKTISTKKTFAKEKLKPIKVIRREGLGLINGTSAMTGIGLTNLIRAKRLVDWSVIISSMLLEIFEAYDDAISFELNNVKHHPGQKEIAKKLRDVLKGRKLRKKRHEFLYNKEVKEQVLNERVQEYYSIRCVPQILGPILDTIKNCEKVVLNELNSANDNPVVDYKHKNFFHGGNFHGDYVSLEMDKLKIATTKLSMLSERQLAFILNDNLTQKLPPFVNLGKLGLNLGMQGVQFTATSTVAENQTLSFPMYIHSITTNKQNQDVVSMGTNSANLTHQVINNTYEVLAIEYMAVLQAIDYLKIQNKMSAENKKIHKKIRKFFSAFTKDSVRFKELHHVKRFLEQH